MITIVHVLRDMVIVNAFVTLTCSLDCCHCAAAPLDGVVGCASPTAASVYTVTQHLFHWCTCS